MGKVFKETVNIQPQTIATGQPQALMSLSEKLQDFSTQAAQFTARKQIESATIKGQAAGLEQQKAGGPLELKEETFIGGISKKAFNTAAREGYLKSLDNDNIESITNLASQFGTDLQGFNDGANAYAKGVMANVDPSSRSAVALSIDSMVSRYRPKIQAAQAKQIVDDANQTQQINAEERSRLAQNSAFDGNREQAGINLAAAIDSIDNRTDLNDVQKSVAIRNVQLEERKSFNSGELSRLYDEEGSEAALDRLSEMDGSPPTGFTPNEWDSFISSESKTLNRRISREKKQTAEDIKAAKLAASVARGKLFTNPDIPADPNDDREDINNFYDAQSQEWESLPTQEQIDLNVEFTNNTGLVPDAMISNVNASMRSGNPEQVALMSDFISRVQEESPGSLKDIPQESRAIALQVTDAQRAGMDVEVALEQARKSAFGLTDTEKDTIRLHTQAVSKGLSSDLQSMANKDLDEGGFDTGIVSLVPDVPGAMDGDFRNSFARFMNLTAGNVDQSTKLAFEATKSVWSVTETGGPKRFMKYAPEVMYHINGVNPNWIEDQFNQDMENAGAQGAILATDNSVARERSPSYPVLVQNEDGILQPLRDENGVNLRYKPDYKATEEYQDLVGEPGKKIETAKKQRKINLERRANVIRRGIMSRVLGNQSIPFNERADFLQSEEGRTEIGIAIHNMRAAGRLDDVEAKEALNAFDL